MRWQRSSATYSIVLETVPVTLAHSIHGPELQYYAATETTGKYPYQLIDTVSFSGARLSIS